MNVGDEKGVILSSELKAARPKLVLEVSTTEYLVPGPWSLQSACWFRKLLCKKRRLCCRDGCNITVDLQLSADMRMQFGGYCGYSAVLIGSQLPTGSRLISIEINPVYAAISSKILEFAGLSDRVQVWVADVPAALPRVKEACGAGSVDFVFIDHWKDVYLRDIKNLEASGLLRPGSVIVADNVICPGAPDYLRYVQEEARDRYETRLVMSHLEYHVDVEDGLAISRVLKA